MNEATISGRKLTNLEKKMCALLSYKSIEKKSKENKSFPDIAEELEGITYRNFMHFLNGTAWPNFSTIQNILAHFGYELEIVPKEKEK